MDELISKLKEAFPIKRRLVIRRIIMHDVGSTSINDSETQITICIKRGAAGQEEILAHEWAHALEFDKYGNHSKIWGKFYAGTYTLATGGD